MSVLVSPAPVEVARLPHTLEEPIRITDYGRVLAANAGQELLSNLPNIYLPCFDYLRLTALSLGKVLVDNGADPDLTLVDIRSGRFRPDEKAYRLGWHYDIDQDFKTPQAVYMLCSAAAGQVAVGCVELGETGDGEGSGKAKPFGLTQAINAEAGNTCLDISNADVVDLEPGVLYFLDVGTVHRSPQVDMPVGRNFFRFKDLRS